MNKLQPTMQRRHYEYIAYVLSRASNSATKKDIINLFINRLIMTNPKFNIAEFKEACECKPEQER